MGNEEFSFLDEDEEPDRDDFPERQVPKAARRRDLRGKLYTIPSSSTQADPAPGPVEPGAGDGKAHKYTLTFQPTKMPTATAPTGNTTPFLYALVTYWQGDMSYQFPYAFTTNALQVRRFFCCSADRIQVDLFVNPGINPSSGGEMRVSIAQGEVRSTDFYTWQPSREIANLADNGQLVAPAGQGINGGQLGPGVVGQLHYILTTAAAPGTALYVLLFDSAVAPVNGQEAIAGGTSDALFATGDSRSYSDEWAPGFMCFSQGLWAALSTTAQTYTAPGAGNVLYAFAKVGQ